MSQKVLKLIHPSTCLVSGPTGCGKTQFVSRLIEHDMIEPKPDRVQILYGEWQSAYDNLQVIRPDIDFIKGFPPNFYDSLDPKVKNLVILDDQMSKIGDSKDLSRLFTQGSHHRNLSIIYIVQNLFDKGKSQRTVSLNSQYFVLFKNPRDKSQIDVLARQMFPKNTKFLVGSFLDATTKPYGYLFIDLRPETDEDWRLRSFIFPGEELLVYNQD